MKKKTQTAAEIVASLEPKKKMNHPGLLLMLLSPMLLSSVKQQDCRSIDSTGRSFPLSYCFLSQPLSSSPLSASRTHLLVVNADVCAFFVRCWYITKGKTESTNNRNESLQLQKITKTKPSNCCCCSRVSTQQQSLLNCAL